MISLRMSAIPIILFWLIRFPVRLLGAISSYGIFVALTLYYMGMQTDQIVGREVSPDQSRVVLVNHRVRVRDVLFRTTTTDAVWLLKASEEEAFRHTLSEHHTENLIMTRRSETNRIEDRPLIRWLSVDQLDVTAPIPVPDSSIGLWKQSLDGVTINFSFEESSEARQRRKDAFGAGARKSSLPYHRTLASVAITIVVAVASVERAP